MDTGEIRYAVHDDAHLAYRTWGEGPSLLYVPSQFVPIAAIAEEPSYRRFVEQLARFSTVIVFDRRGIGLSDPMAGPPTVDDWAAQIETVLDDAGCDAAHLLAHSWGGLPAVTLAARRPRRVRSLILANAVGVPGKPLDMSVDDVVSTASPSNPTPAVDFLQLLAPSRADDPAFRRWWESAGRRGASPAVAQQLLALHASADVTDLLPSVQVPTLVIHRPAASRPFRQARPFGIEIPDATLVEVEGEDVLIWVGDSSGVTDEIEGFVTGHRGPLPDDRELLAMMFSDVVGSTAAVARFGDARWREILDLYDDLMREELSRHGGRPRGTAGDGWFSTFATPSGAARCARSLHRRMAEIGIRLRVGIHCSEVEVRGDDVAGVGVHLAARVEGAAEPGETWVTQTVKDAMAGSPFTFAERGTRELKGIPGAWPLYALD